MTTNAVQPGQILTGSLFNEPMRVETVAPNGPDSWVLGLVGTQSAISLRPGKKLALVALNSHVQRGIDHSRLPEVIAFLVSRAADYGSENCSLHLARDIVRSVCASSVANSVGFL